MHISSKPSTRRSLSLLAGSLLIVASTGTLGGNTIYDTRGEYWVDGPDSDQPGSDRGAPDVAIGPNGVAVHVWEAFTSNRYDIFVQRFDRTDQPIGDPAPPPQLVNTLTPNDQRDPRIAVRPDGSFYVVWQSNELDPEQSTNRRWVRGQLFDSDGTPQGSELLISELSSGTSTDIHATVAALENGSFVVTWHSINGFGSDSQPCVPTPSTGCGTFSVQARTISSNGSALGGQFQVNSEIDGGQYHPAVVATTDGGFAIFWSSFSGNDDDLSSGSIQGRRFAANGTPLGDDFQVNTTTDGSQDSPEASTDSWGRIAVVYESPNADNSQTSIRARMFESDLSPIGNDFLVPGLTSGVDQYDPRVAGGFDFFLVAWTVFGGVGSDTDFAVNGRIAYSDGQFGGTQFQVNVFEDGSQQSHAVGARGANALVSWRSSPTNAFELDDGIIARGYAFDQLFADRFE